MALFAVAAEVRAQFIANVPVSSGIYRYGDTSNWSGSAITGVFTNNTGVSTIVFQSGDVNLPSGLSFSFSNSSTVNLEASGGPYTLLLGGDVAMNNGTNAMMTIGSFVAGNELDIAMAADRTFTIATTNLMVLPNVVSGAGKFTKAGGGTLTLDNANTFTGGTEITGGVLQLGDFSISKDGSVLGDASHGIAISSGAAVSFSSYNDSIYNGVISGAGQLIKDGSAKLTVTAANTYSGGTVIRDGTLDVGGYGTTGSITGNVNLISATSLLHFDRSDAVAVSYNGIIQGSGGVSKDGPGTLTFNDAQTYTGTTYVGAGTLTTSGANQLSPNSIAKVNTIGTLALSAANTVGGLRDGDSGGSVTLGANLTLNTALAVDVSFAGVISGTGALIKTGQGKQRLTGTNTYSGGTTLKDGTLVIRGDGQLGATTGALTFDGGGLLTDLSLTLVAGRSVIFTGAGTIDNSGNSLTISAPLSGSGAFSANGSGTTTLAGASATFTGSTSIFDGCLTIGALNALGTSSAVTLATTGTLNLAANQTISSLTSGSASTLVNFNSGEVLTIDAGTAATFSGVIGGNGSLVITGTATQTLAGTNTYTGTTSMNGGVLAVSSESNLGTGSSALIFNGGSLQANSTLLITRGLTLNAGGGTIRTNTFQTTVSGVIAGAGSLTHQGTGILTLSGTNNYTGGTLIQGGGVLDFTADANLGASSSGVTLDGGFLRTQAAIPTFTHAITLGASGGNVNSNGFNSTLTGAITGTGNLTTQSQTGNGVLTLTNGGNNYTGATFVNSGTLQVGVANALPTTTKVTISSGATLDVAFDQTVAGLSSTGVAAIGSGMKLTVNATTASLQFDGVISGAGSFVKNGSSALNLAGVNTYTGGTTINFGTLNLLNASGSGTGTGDVNIASGASLAVGGGFTVGSLTGNIANAGTVGFSRSDAVTYGGVISGTGTVNVLGSGGLMLTGASTYTGGTSVGNGAKLILGNASGTTLSTTSDLTLIGTGNLQIDTDQTIGALQSTSTSASVAVASGKTLTISNDGAHTGTFAGSINGAGALVKADVGSLVLTGSNVQTGGTTINGGTLNIGDGATNGSVSGNITNNASLVFNRADDISISSIISGTGTLNKFGAGHLTLNGANSYAGNNVILSGYLVLGTGGTLPGNVTFTGNSGVGGGELQFATTSNVLFSGTITGPGRVTQLGSGTISLGGDNKYTGFTTVSAGTLNIVNATGSATGSSLITVNTGAMLQIGTGGTVGAVSGDIANNGTVTFNRSNSSSYGGVISGPSTANVSIAGSGVTTFTGANTYTGTTTIGTGATLVLGNSSGNTLSTGADVSLSGTGTLSVNFDQTIRGLISNSSTSVISIATGKTLTSNLPFGQSNLFAGTLMGAGNFTKDGPGTLTFSSDQGLTGLLTVNSGTLQLGNGGTAGGFAGNIVINSGGNLTFNRSDATALLYSGILSGAGSFTKLGSATLVLTGANTFTGNVSISGGTLSVGVANAVPNVAVNVNSGTTFDVANDTTIATLTGTGSTVVASGKTLRLNNGQPLSSVISGAGDLEIGNVVTLTADQTFTGTTTIKGGTLNFGNGGTAGSVAGNVVIGPGGSGVQFNRSDAYSYSGVISGNGFLNKNANNTLTLTGANTFTGSTSVNAGTLKVAAANALPTTTSVSISGGAALDIAANQTISRFGSSLLNSSIVVEASQILNVTLGTSATGTNFQGVISGAGTFEVGTAFGAHTVTLLNDNTYTGGTIVDSGGVLRLGADTGTGMVVGNITDNGGVIFQHNNKVTFNGVISGTGFLQQGTATGGSNGGISLSAANTYVGGTQVLNGFLFATNTTGSATGTGAVTVSGQGFFGGNGNISGPLNVNLGGMVAPVSVGLPAALKVGATTFAGGGIFGFVMGNATGASGTDFSLLSISGALSITADALNPFVVEMYSFSAPDTIGAALNFNPSLPQTWTFATASGGISGFNAAAFVVDSSVFASANVGTNTSPGSFTVGLSGSSLLLQYSPTAVPEPSTWALLVAGLGIVALATVRSRRSFRIR